MNGRIMRLEASFPDADGDWLARFVRLCVGLTGEPREAFWKCVVSCGRTRRIARRAAGLEPLPEPEGEEAARVAATVCDDDFERGWAALLQRLADRHKGRPCDKPGCRFGVPGT